MSRNERPGGPQGDDECDRLGLGRVGHEADAVAGQAVAVGDLAVALAAGLLGQEGGAGAGLDQQALVLAEGVDDAAHQDGGGVVGLGALAGGGDDAGAGPLDGGLDHGGGHHVAAGEPVALGDEEDAAAGQRGEGVEEDGPFLQGQAAGHGVLEDGCDLPAIALGGGPAGGELGFEAQARFVLLVGRDAQINDRTRASFIPLVSRDRANGGVAN